jgi:hypothetical protein
VKHIIPDDVTGWRSAEFNAIFACLRALWLKRSATLLCNTASDGTSIEVKRPGAGGASSFTGTAYVAGNKTTGLGTKKWVRVFLDSGTAEDNDGDPPNPFPPNEEWYEVANTSGDIHCARA